MSLEKLDHMFSALSTCEAWSIQLLKINTSKRAATTYMGREITFAPNGQLRDFVSDIVGTYIGKKGILHAFTDVREYDGSALNQVIYKLPITSELIAEEYKAFLEGIAQPYAEINPLEIKFQAYVLNGLIKLDGEDFPVKLISMQNPITTLKHKFMEDNGTFKEISDKVLSLKTIIDVIIFDQCIYMLTLAGEKLFNMERSYRAVCAAKIANLKEYDIVTDFKTFSSTAGSGHNPRKFVSFNDEHLKKLKSKPNRIKIAQKFKIPLKADKFDTSKVETVNKLIKILCNRGMVDPFDDNPMEVAGSKKWE